MKVLILTATIGQGHNAVARSLSNRLDELGIPCCTVDMYEAVSPTLKSIVQGGYLLSIRSVVHARTIGVKYYNAMERSYRPSKNKGLSAMPTKAIAAELKKRIDAFDPDVIICTQVYCAHALNLMKALCWIHVPTVAVITDFTVQAHWEGTSLIDHIVVPTKGLLYQLQSKGIPVEKIVETGIPIHPKFATAVPKETARAKLGLHPDKPTLFVMGGSMGYGNMTKTIEKLDALPLDFQGIVVCGNNKSLYKKLSSLSLTKDLRIMGYCDNVPLIMDASDAMITKPGGISMSEGLAKQLPMILANAIPGMEDHNGEFMVNHGIAVLSSKTLSIEEAVYSLFTDETYRCRLAENMADYSHPNATADLCDFLLSLGEK